MTVAVFRTGKKCSAILIRVRIISVGRMTRIVFAVRAVVVSVFVDISAGRTVRTVTEPPFCRVVVFVIKHAIVSMVGLPVVRASVHVAKYGTKFVMGRRTMISVALAIGVIAILAVRASVIVTVNPAGSVMVRFIRKPAVIVMGVHARLVVNVNVLAGENGKSTATVQTT